MLVYSGDIEPLQSGTGSLLGIDPYQHIDFLGSGSYGYVDTVQRVGQPGAVFARKTIRITSGRSRDVQMRSAQSEFKILQRLKHHHVIQVLEMYCFHNKLSVIMLHVAETDMDEYLGKLDEMEVGLARHEMLKPLLMWQGCLAKAIDYLHEMRIKHKDLKPANILVKDGHVLIADFGISKDLIDEETTASRSHGPQGTPMYMAPEISREGRRGRAVDIFSLGCIFLEISTCMLAGPGARARFAEHRNVNGSRAYARCPKRILQWFSYLWGLYAEYNFFETRHHAFPADRIFVVHLSLPGELAFMMLDPDSKKRITTRQLVARIYADLTLYPDVKEKSCRECNTGSSWQDENIPLNSTFHENWDLDLSRPSESALACELGFDWEGAKRKWLASHMWW
jgi:serine/threonine protein kinase